jgi:miniconductance mechanosensitive channel
LYFVKVVFDYLLYTFDDILSKSPVFEGKPITSYIQYLMCEYSGRWNSHLSVAFRKKSFYFLGAMGAMTAILLLIFKDTILGFVEYSNVCV